jgi:membrane dipeptidase
MQIAELYRRNWTQYELAGLTGGNILRVMEGAEKVAEDLQAREAPIYDLYFKRKDIPKYP